MNMNTKVLKTTLGLTIVMLLVSACGMIPTLGSRNLISETRTVSGYQRVEVSGAGTLEIIQDGSESLSIETDDNMMQYVTSEVRGGTLHIGLDSTLRALLPSKLSLTLHVKDLSGITTSGSWEVNSAEIKAASLDIVLSGSGKMTVDSLSVGTLSADISGSGGLTLAGKADSQTIDISGSGKYQAGDLSTKATTVSISGSGNVTVWTSDNLTGHVSGSGDVSYYGNPQVSFDQSGSGKIQGLGNKE
jgi:hypothetical protein